MLRLLSVKFCYISLVIIAISSTACFIVSGNQNVYTSQGVIKGISDDKKTVVIKHHDFVNSSGKVYMSGMTMEFHVKDPQILNGISRNDTVNIELTVGRLEEWVNKLQKTGHDANEDTLDATAAKTEGAMLMDDQAVPDFELTNQDDKQVKLSDFRGKPVVVTFIYTRCPFEDMCPRLTHNFQKIQNELAPKFGTKFELLSVSVDPANDTPAVLRDYAKREHIDLAQWNLLTGKDDQIHRIASNFGVDYWASGGIVNHGMASAVIRPDGTLMKVYRESDWNPGDVVADVTKLLSGS
ncbi:MAG TPA: SCO family protein [Blastocatellia bacterium]|nr:SCO family protein [Blastocatellia bacterium]